MQETPWQEQLLKDLIPLDLRGEMSLDALQNPNSCLPQEPEVLCPHPAAVPGAELLPRTSSSLSSPADSEHPPPSHGSHQHPAHSSTSTATLSTQAPSHNPSPRLRAQV